MSELNKIIIGVISDTHGILRPSIKDVFKDCSRIIHAGDIGKYIVISELESMAAVTAVRGNVDTGDWASAFSNTETICIDNKKIYVLHNLNDISIQPEKSGYDFVISGHSHKPHEYLKNGVFYLNPGSAGPKRFKLPVCAAKIIIEKGRAEIHMIDL